NFIPLLKNHLLSRLMGREFDGDENEFTPEEHATLKILENKIYFHKVVRVNYTTYDMRRDQDMINPRTHPDVMVLAHEDDQDHNANTHPYWYVRVIGIFHVMVEHTGIYSTSKRPRRMDFLWVRWFGRDLSALGGFQTHRLHCIGFVPDDDRNAFGFLDPDNVLRAAHLILAFADGHTDRLLGSSGACQIHGEDDMDYENYYVNM
ncbi:hypothetical protein WOLCODRAFT_74514, partial [Wolfiporia cocos MD-104 SS10]